MNILALRPLSTPISGRATANQADAGPSSADLGDFVSFVAKAGTLAHELQGLDGPFPALASALNFFGNVGPRILSALQSGDMSKVASLCLDAGKQISDIVARLSGPLKEAAEKKVGPLLGAVTSGRDLIDDLDRYEQAPGGTQEARWTGIQASVDGILTLANLFSGTPAATAVRPVLGPVLLVAAMCSIAIGRKARQLRQTRLGKTPCINRPAPATRSFAPEATRVAAAQGPRSSPQARLIQQLSGLEAGPVIFDQVR